MLAARRADRNRARLTNYRHNALYTINDTALQQNGLNPVEIISSTSGTGGGVEVYVIAGNVDIGPRWGDASTGWGIEIEHIRVKSGNVLVQGAVEPNSELRIDGGRVETYNTLADFSGTGSFELNGGELVHMIGAGPGTVIGSGAKLDWRSLTAPTSAMEVKSGGELTFDSDSQEKTAYASDITLHEGAIFSDTYGVCVPVSGGAYRFPGGSRPSSTVILPSNYEYTAVAL